jgi:hypothetical protein
MAVKGGDLFDEIEIPPMPVQIAGDHNLVGRFFRQNNDIPMSCGSMEIGLRGVGEDGNDFFNILLGSDHNLRPAISC